MSGKAVKALPLRSSQHRQSVETAQSLRFEATFSGCRVLEAKVLEAKVLEAKVLEAKVLGSQGAWKPRCLEAMAP
jgi:hypothetical protein